MYQSHYTMRRQRAICADCGRCTYLERHHAPPRCEGGPQAVPRCRRCHVARNPAYWLPNLKQFRDRPLDSLLDQYTARWRLFE